MIWKEFFFFSKGERNGIFILICLVGLMFAVNFCLPVRPQSDTFLLTEQERLLIDSFRTTKQKSVKNKEKVVFSASEKKSRKQDDCQKETSKSFNPSKFQRKQFYDTLRIELNRADTTELKKLRGIGSVLSKRIVKYRKSIGKFRSVDDLKKVYGLSEETYLQILPYVWVDTMLNKQKAELPKE